MKKLISLITIIAILLTSVALLASCGGSSAAASVASTDAKGITYSYDSATQTLKIWSTKDEPAKMEACEKGAAPWYSLRNSVKFIEITNVANISDYAFYSMYYLTKVTFNDEKVTEIGTAAFAFCASLTEIKLPEGITAIGESAFEACSTLKSIKLPQSVTKLGDKAFAFDRALTEVTLSDTLKDGLDTEKVFYEITAPKLNYVATPVEGETNESTEAPAESETTKETEESKESESETEKETEKETEDKTEAPAVEKTNDTTTIIAIVVLALVIIGIIVGAILLMRSNKKQTNDSRTVRKNPDEKNGKKSAKGKKK